jgi:transcriptional antiterminator
METHLMPDSNYISPEQAAKRLNFSTRYFRNVIIKKELEEGIHYIYAFNGRKILLLWDRVEEELLKSLNENNTSAQVIPMSSGGICNV